MIPFIALNSFLFIAPTVIRIEGAFDFIEQESLESVKKVVSIKLKNDKNKLSWDVDGDSTYGYKVIWSQNQNPVFPGRTEDKNAYISNPGIKTITLDENSNSGAYYVRVCEYKNEKCGIYSNEILISIGATNSKPEDIIKARKANLDKIEKERLAQIKSIENNKDSKILIAEINRKANIKKSIEKNDYKLWFNNLKDKNIVIINESNFAKYAQSVRLIKIGRNTEADKLQKDLKITKEIFGLIKKAESI
jgi:hypothetical protein